MISTKIFLAILYVPRFSDLEWGYACQENTLEYEQLAAFVAG